MEGSHKKGKSKPPVAKGNFVAPKNPLLELSDEDERKLRLSVKYQDMFFRHPHDLAWLILEALEGMGEQPRNVVTAAVVGFNARDNVNMSQLVDSNMDVVQRNYATRLSLSLEDLKNRYPRDLVSVVKKLVEAQVITEKWVVPFEGNRHILPCDEFGTVSSSQSSVQTFHGQLLY